MEIDITSVIIGLISLATFALPIGYDQIKVKRSKQHAEQQFLKTASDLEFKHESFEVLQNKAAVGLSLPKDKLLYVKSTDDYKFFELRNVISCSPYKSDSMTTDKDGHRQTWKEMGIKVSFRNSGDIRLPVFEGRDGTQQGIESLYIERWMSNINKAAHSIPKHVSATA